jgi:hypothetical protein
MALSRSAEEGGNVSRVVPPLFYRAAFLRADAALSGSVLGAGRAAVGRVQGAGASCTEQRFDPDPIDVHVRRQQAGIAFVQIAQGANGLLERDAIDAPDFDSQALEHQFLVMDRLRQLLDVAGSQRLAFRLQGLKQLCQRPGGRVARPATG